MAIADNVLGRLVRFNAARGKPGDQPRVPIRRRLGALLLRGIGILRWMVLLAILALIGWAANYEMRTSYLEACCSPASIARCRSRCSPGRTIQSAFRSTGPMTSGSATSRCRNSSRH